VRTSFDIRHGLPGIQSILNIIKTTSSNSREISSRLKNQQAGRAVRIEQHQAACGAFRCTGNFSCPEKCHIFQSLPPRAVTCSALSLRLHLPAGRSARDPTSPPFASERAAPGLPRALPVAPPALQWRGVHGRDARGSGELPLVIAARPCDKTRAFTGTPSYWRRRAPSSEKRAKTE
jgi:hypothetical protein